MLTLTNIRSPIPLARIATVVVLLTALVILYWPTWSGLADNWSFDSESYSHGFLIALISLGLLLKSVLAVAPSGDRYLWLAAIVLVGTSAVWLIAHISNILVAQAVILPILLLSALSVVFGVRSAPVFAFPLAYFYFAIPTWNFLTGILQWMTIEVFDEIAGFFRIPAFIEGSFVILPNGVFEIAGGCAGVHFLVVGLAIGTLYASQNLETRSHQLFFVLCALVVSILMNWIRVTTIVFAGYVSDMQHYLVTVDHYGFGWALFTAMLVPLFLFGHILANSESPKISRDSPQPTTDPVDESTLSFIGRTGIALLLLTIMPATALELDRRANRDQIAQIELPETLGDWRWQRLPTSTWRPQFPGAAQEGLGRYRYGDKSVELYVNMYTKQSQGAELINETNSLFNRIEMRVSSRIVVPVQLSGGSPIRPMQLEVVGRGDLRQYFVYWYFVYDEVVVDATEVKYREFRQHLNGRAASGIVAFRVECRRDCGEKLDMTFEFLEAYGAVINNAVFGSLREDAETVTVSE